jgi:hypothetical protein
MTAPRRQTRGRPAAERSAVAPALLVVAALAALAVPGCATGLGADGPGRTGGRTVEMMVQRPERSFARYRVERDGRLRFAGGTDALDRKFTWSGPLTGDEIDALFARLDELGWWRADPVSSGKPPDVRARIELTGPGGRRSFDVIGADPGAASVETILAAAARRRLDGVLDGLPRAGDARE